MHFEISEKPNDANRKKDIYLSIHVRETVPI